MFLHKELSDKAEGSEAFFNLEPGAHGKTCIERKGIVNFNFTVTGIEAHSSLCATQGANAILDAAYKIIECEKLKDHNGVTCCCTIVNGGSKGNIVPGQCKFIANVRYATKAQYDETAKFMEELAANALSDIATDADAMEVFLNLKGKERIKIRCSY